MKTPFLLLLFLGSINLLYAQSLPTERLADWSQAGMINELPTGEIIDFKLEKNSTVPQRTNDEVIQQLIEDGDGTPQVIYFGEGTYIFNEPIELKSNILLKGVSAEQTHLVFNLKGSHHLISANGQQTISRVSLLEDGSKEDRSIIVSSAELFQTGDFVKIIDIDTALVTSDWAIGSTGQILEIDQISGNEITFKDQLRRSFKVSHGAEIIKLDMIENIGIELLSIERKDSTQSQTSNIYFNYVLNSEVSCIKSKRCNFAHIDIRNSAHVKVSGSYMEDAFSFGNGGKAYGAHLAFSTSNCLIEDNMFNTLRHAMLIQAGANGNVIAYNYSINPFWTEVNLPRELSGDIVLHGNYPYCNLMEGNVAQNIYTDASHGTNGPLNTFFRNRSEFYGIYILPDPASHQQNVIGNEIVHGASYLGQYYLFGNDHFEYSNNVKGEIKPAGTEILLENSLYLSEVPDYYLNNNWPPIGWPNTPNQNRIAAQERFNKGQLTLCGQGLTTSVRNRISSLNQIQIFPNPANEILNLRYSKDLETAFVKMNLYSIDGQLLWSGRLQPALNVSQYLQGFYLLELKEDDGKSVFHKWIKS